ncbi:tungstate ABC transporter substrate-binding protein WtpA [Methanogenium sp. S4BF]|uniref:tungstate ABC transporter substrate-binding protein WtpA n=1 Tax=Methanogenium sp. S4BF TaxID=1789226 RepID=UPI002416372A|nr:tungstate ABC transporter substrate-binding protein WtpA [Methanogenium sp. S4BF]WFN34212.1 tungstate ABC transporter substrate-binding protein WtpA [Methanogenium sp. S4BF]
MKSGNSGPSPFLSLLLCIGVAALILAAGCSDAPEKTIVNVVPAGSLLGPMETMEAEYEALHPEIDIRSEGHGSIQCIRQVTDLHRDFDVVIVADESLIPDMMYIPRADGNGAYATTYTPLARNEMVIAYTNLSRYADEFSADNWIEILCRPDVRTGLSNPMLDAAGYRGLMVLLLAENYYGTDDLFDTLISQNLAQQPVVMRNGTAAEVILPETMKTSGPGLVIRDGSVYLLSLLEAGGIDYAFEYRSVAEEHGLRYLPLPAEIDLSSPTYADRYDDVSVTLGYQRFSSIGSERTGRPIVYGITVPTTATHPEEGEQFALFVIASMDTGYDEWPRPYYETNLIS